MTGASLLGSYVCMNIHRCIYVVAHTHIYIYIYTHLFVYLGVVPCHECSGASVAVFLFPYCVGSL